VISQTCCLGIILSLLMSTAFAFAAEAKRVIVALGDSTTAGTPGFKSAREAPPHGLGDEESQYAYWIMKHHPDWKVINQGINGQRSNEIASRFDKDVAAVHPDTVIVLAGVNDLFQGRGSADVIKSLTSIYEKSKSRKIRVVACTILPYNGMTPRVRRHMREVNQWIREYAREHRLIFCDTFHLLEDAAHPGNLISTFDGYHPDVAGYRKMGEFIAERLEEEKQENIVPDTN